jgi:hypothetical protein
MSAKKPDREIRDFAGQGAASLTGPVPVAGKKAAIPWDGSDQDEPTICRQA